MKCVAKASLEEKRIEEKRIEEIKRKEKEATASEKQAAAAANFFLGGSVERSVGGAFVASFRPYTRGRVDGQRTYCGLPIWEERHLVRL